MGRVLAFVLPSLLAILSRRGQIPPVGCHRASSDPEARRGRAWLKIVDELSAIRKLSTVGGAFHRPLCCIIGSHATRAVEEFRGL